MTLLQALILANKKDRGHILCDTTGIIFLGTPHRGSRFALLGKIWTLVSLTLGYSTAISLFKTLAYYSEVLDDLGDEFLQLKEIVQLLANNKIVCFFETKGGLWPFGVGVNITISGSI